MDSISPQLMPFWVELAGSQTSEESHEIPMICDAPNSLRVNRKMQITLLPSPSRSAWICINLRSEHTALRRSSKGIGELRWRKMCLLSHSQRMLLFVFMPPLKLKSSENFSIDFLRFPLRHAQWLRILIKIWNKVWQSWVLAAHFFSSSDY